MKGIQDTILVSVSGLTGDAGVLLVGKKNAKGVVEIINAFEGKEASELFKKLVTRDSNERKTLS